MEAVETAKRPSLGGTAKAVWDAWRKEEYLGGTSCFARAVLEEGLAELVWVNGGKGQLQLGQVVDQIGSKPLSAQDEERVWQALLEGRLQIYRRRNSPSTGAIQVTRVLHQATGRSMQSGTDQ